MMKKVASVVLALLVISVSSHADAPRKSAWKSHPTRVRGLKLKV